MPSDLYTYAGVPLSYALPEVVAEVRSVHKMGELFQPPRHRAAQSLMWPWEWLSALPVHLGRLRWPTGASRFAYGCWLATDEQLKAIRQKVKTSFGGYSAQTLILGDGTDYIETDLYMLPPRPLSGFPGATSSNRLWMLPLVDERYWWWWRTASIEVEGGTTTWASLISSLAAALGTGITTDGVSADYLTPHTMFTTRYEYLPPLLDEVARSIGCRVTRQLDGEVRLETTTHAHTQEKANRKAYPDSWMGGELDLLPYLDGDYRSALPSAVNVVHWKVVDDVPDDTTEVVQVTLGEVQPLRPNLVKAKANTEALHQHSLACAIYTGANWDNETELTDLDKALVGDWYEWQLSYSDRTIRGIADWTPTGLNDWVEWWHDGTADGVGTSVYRPPQVSYDEVYFTHAGIAIPPWGVWDTLIVKNLYVLDQVLGPGVAKPNREVVYGTDVSIDSHDEFKFYYDTTQNITVGDVHDWFYVRMSLLAHGATNRQGILVTYPDTDETAKGAMAIVSPRYTNSNLPSAGYGCWDSGTARELYVGGGGIASQPDATAYKLYIAPTYTETNNTGVLAQLSDNNGNRFNSIALTAVPLIARGFVDQTADLFRVEKNTAVSGIAPAVTVDDVGDVCIGAEAPRVKLDVIHTDTGSIPETGSTVVVEAFRPLINLLASPDGGSATDGAGEIAFGHDGDANEGRIVYSAGTVGTAASGQRMEFHVGAALTFLVHQSESFFFSDLNIVPGGSSDTGVVLDTAGQVTIFDTVAGGEPSLDFVGNALEANAQLIVTEEAFTAGEIPGLLIHSIQNDGGTAVRLKFDPGNGRVILSSIPAIGVEPWFAVDDGTAVYDGVWGTNVIGDVFAGGICVEIGEGGASGTDALGNTWVNGILTEVGGGAISGGTVTSVGLSAPDQFTVMGSPVTSSGTLTLGWATHSANMVLAGPTSGGAAHPTFRTLVPDDLPEIKELSLTRNNPDATTPVFNVHQDHASNDSPAARINQDGTWAILELQSGGSTVASFDSLGALTITQARVPNQLELEGTTSTYARMTATTGQAGVKFAQDTNQSQVFADATNPLNIYDTGGGAYRAVCDADGNWSFGSKTTAAARLEVYRNDNTSSVPVMKVHQDHASSSENALEAVSDGTGSAGDFWAGSTNHVIIGNPISAVEVSNVPNDDEVWACVFETASGVSLRVRGDGQVLMLNLSTSDPGIAGAIWRSGNDVKVSTG